MDNSITKKFYNNPLLWFVLGFGLFIFTRTRTFIPLAIIIGT